MLLAPGDRPARRVRGPRHHPVLRVLRVHADPAVLPDRHLGRARSGATRRVKFFLYTLAGSLLTLLGLLAHRAAGLPSQRRRGALDVLDPELTRSMQACRRASAAAIRLAARAIFLALFAGLRDQGAAVPAAHLAAAGARRGADGRQRAAGRRAAEDRHLRLPAVLPAAAARRHGRRACRWVLWLSVVGIIYGALVALAQSDMKQLIAYSRVSHLGFCMLGLFALNRLGLHGGVLQMINHGLSTGGAVPPRRHALRALPHAADRRPAAAWPRGCRCWRSSCCCSRSPASACRG